MFRPEVIVVCADANVASTVAWSVEDTAPRSGTVGGVLLVVEVAMELRNYLASGVDAGGSGAVCASPPFRVEPGEKCPLPADPRIAAAGLTDRHYFPFGLKPFLARLQAE